MTEEEDRDLPGSITEFPEAWRRVGLTALSLWIGYVTVGGDGSPDDVERWLAGLDRPSMHDHDLLAQALNDGFTELGMNHPVRYSSE